MNDLDALAQLVFFVLIVAGWVIKAVVEARQAKRRREAGPPPETEAVPEASDRVLRPRPTPPPIPTSARRPRSTRLRDEERLGHLDPGLAARHLDPTVGAAAPGRLLLSSAAAVAHGATARKEQRRSVLARLTGGVEVTPGKELTRAGVLWSEILGPCRALRGPHRSPAATRTRAR